MALLIQKVEEDIKGKLTIPAGWLTVEELEKKHIRDEEVDIKEFEESVSRYLPLATKRAEKLINDLNEKLNIRIPISYLSIENSTTFHVVMLVAQEDYLAPEMQKARLLVEKDKSQDREFDMHYVFTVGTEYMQRSSIIPNSYKLKHIPDFERNMQIELVYLSQLSKAI